MAVCTALCIELGGPVATCRGLLVGLGSGFADDESHKIFVLLLSTFESGHMLSTSIDVLAGSRRHQPLGAGALGAVLLVRAALRLLVRARLLMRKKVDPFIMSRSVAVV